MGELYNRSLVSRKVSSWMKEKVIDTKAGDLITKVADKVGGLADNYPEEEQLHLANQLRYSASVISLALDIIKTNVSQQKQEFIRCIDRIENSLLEIINNLKIALIREYIKNNDYDEACNLIERLHCKLITLKKSFHSG